MTHPAHRAFVYIVVILVILILALTVRLLWIETHPPAVPMAWRDKARGNVCYLWSGELFCMSERR